MMKLGKKQSMDIINQGAKAMCGFSYGLAILIYDIEHGIDDYVLWGWNNEHKVHKSKIRYSKDEYSDDYIPFFGYGYGGRVYLNECLKCSKGGEIDA